MDSFGSKDSLTDSIPTGNVAAYRKSLESKCTESTVPIVQRKMPVDMKSTAEIRKSLENLDERKSTPPPVLSKKPIVPIKKSPTVGSVGNIFSGLKQKVEQKVRSVEQKIVHHDSLDGIGSSKQNSQIADNNEKGVSGERLRRDESEFDQVERNSSILQDVRKQRGKAPKRRLPSSNSGSLGENPLHQNGDAPAVPASPPPMNDVNKSDEDLTKPKPREWEKNRAPWMDELKASQAKKTSPGIEIRSPDSTSITSTTTTHGSNSFDSSHIKKETNSFEVRSSSVDVKSSNDSTFHSNSIKKEATDSNSSMTKSLSSLATKISISETSINSNDETTTTNSNNNNNISIKSRPTSVTLRNVNLPPVSRISKTIHDNGGVVQTSTATITKSATVIQDDSTNHFNSGPTIVTTDNVCTKYAELELRVQKLEKLVQKQNLTIEELLKSLKDESDKVKTLKHELDKYAQCVTQV